MREIAVAFINENIGDMRKLMLALAVVMPFMVQAGANSEGGIEGGKKSNLNVAPADTLAPGRASVDLTYAAKISRPAVVHIRTFTSMPEGPAISGSLKDLLEELYGDQIEIPEPETNGEPEHPLASASGVIISTDGYIVSNNHVIENAEKIEVTLFDKRSYVATLVGTDPQTDLSLLKIEATNLPAIKFANHANLEIGEWVLAVGNPFNLTSTVTAGIVSAIGRNVGVLSGNDNLAVESFIQTDAVVNVGNSGGALVNLKGELVGINTAIATPTGTFAGYSFAVPVNLVQKVVGDIREFGRVQRALLGVTVMDIDAALKEERKLKDFSGVYIDSVLTGSSAAKAGLKKGDVIRAIDNEVVDSPSKLQEVIATRRPGDKIIITFQRDNRERKVEVLLKNVSGTTELVKNDPESIENLLGAEVGPVSTHEASRLNIKGGFKVYKISRISLRKTGMSEGFIITHIDKMPLKSMDDMQRILKKSKGTDILLQGVYPDGKKAFYAVSN
ncbi:MAG: trypsin-like peptidase domain-containing protein [Cytophagaceae bacterium]